MRAIRAALRTGIARQGSTLSDYAKPDGSPGSMQDEFRVYGRDGEPCRAAATTITKTRVGGRGHVVLPALPAARAQLLSPRASPVSGDPAAGRVVVQRPLALALPHALGREVAADDEGGSAPPAR